MGHNEKKDSDSLSFKPLSGREFPRFSAIKTFFRLPHVSIQENFDVALFGLPFDGGVSYRPGARFAPQKVREASSLGRGYHYTRREQLFEKLKIADVGDCPVVPIDLEKTYKQIEKFVDDILVTNKKFISIGGDHSTTLPVLRSLRKKYCKPLNLIHFDAHLDTYPAAWGCEYHHGSFLRHAIDEGLVRPDMTFQFGIRGPLAGSDDLDFIRQNRVQVYDVDQIKLNFAQFLKNLPVLDNNPTYISFDIDCLDPAFAPGTGTPVVGGLTTYEVQQILRSLKIPNLVAADIVEICPAYDHADITALAGVDALFEILNLFKS